MIYLYKEIIRYYSLLRFAISLLLVQFLYLIKKIGIYSMLEHIKYLPAHVLGMHAAGHVTIGDYEKALRPLLEQQVKQTGRINFLLVLETNIKNFAAGAWCGNIRLGLKYLTRWNKVAVVTDQDGVREFSHLFKYILPGKFAGYRLEELDEAVKWITGIK